ncbi:AmiS/UreI family transporter [Bacillus thuringiensis]|uniref:Urease accessory protein UreI n=4 Tax=Bacillus cereus group TaxID=86661 RepID=A0A9X6WQW2_BACTU|nr:MULTISPECIES: AmiS/UreI family transporter [Bacillus]KAB2377306.1 urease accessory protein UreI [Bacillus sp. RM2(2019)]KXY68993.1 urease accessory protein UreI [Bacillus cereus]MBK5493052.1 AmiS/UreI family transporter [Bacillus sp. TH13]MCC6079510.1 AmiS/UreI family transporter [Bacillus thuringiensis]MCR6781663.1 AmiS/UreI family transporter [Bacillus thuringiensis]
MTNVGLLFVGAVLFMNSLAAFKLIDSKSVGCFNLFVGALQTLTPLYLLFTGSQSDEWTILSNGTIFLFGFTYLYVGLTNILKLDSSGVGYYSLWVAIIATVMGIVNQLHESGSLQSTIIWFFWAFLWFLFFLQDGLKKKIHIYVGIVCFVESWITATVPALLTLTNHTGVLNNFVIILATIITIVVFIMALFFFKSIQFKVERVSNYVEK